MADTVGNMIIRVLRASLQSPNKTAPSDNDDTQLILDKLNEAQELLRDLSPTQVDEDAAYYLDELTRTIDVPVSGLDIHDIHAWSFQLVQPDGVRKPLELVTNQLVYETYPRFELDAAEFPRFVYLDNGQLAHYPLIKAGAGAQEITFKYSAMAVRRTDWDQVYPFPNNWLLWMEKYAQYFYEMQKGLGNPPATAVVMETLYGRIFGKVKRTKQIRIKGYRQPRNRSRVW